ncbi:MAG TPA: 5'/3'-nucleotidase SurE [Opitutaceae bacterium]|nr:5'/3'-nucleotidase SurE [Opitutaceae bacterium]
MKILVTNDDGIDSVFLHELVFALLREGHELFVAAPMHEQSWIGAAKSRNRPVSVKVADRGFGCKTWVVDGTPSDCVNIAIAHLIGIRPDAVVSGINIGLNASLGFILASGTIAGAWEGAVHGLPAIAISQDLTFPAFDNLKKHGGAPEPELLETLRVSAKRTAQMANELIGATERESFTVHNLNFPYPCRHDTAIERTSPARVIIPQLFGPAADDGTHRFVFRLGHDISPPESKTDRAALLAGKISHTVLDYRALGVQR